MNIRWTGFEPFGTLDYNPSWDVARVAAQTAAGRADSTAERLPVEFDVAKKWARRRLEGGASDRSGELVVHTGVAASREYVALERTARNLRGEDPEEADESAVDEPLIDDGPERLHTSVPLEKLCRFAREAVSPADLPAFEISDDAGDFVCNALYFHTLSVIENAVFIHVPMMTTEEAEQLGMILGEAVLQLGAQSSGSKLRFNR